MLTGQCRRMTFSNGYPTFNVGKHILGVSRKLPPRADHRKLPSKSNLMVNCRVARPGRTRCSISRILPVVIGNKDGKGEHKLKEPLMSVMFSEYIVCDAKGMITAQTYVLTSLPAFVTPYRLQRKCFLALQTYHEMFKC